MNDFDQLNRFKLTDLAKDDDTKLDLVVEVDYLGHIDVESKYLQLSTIQWLIAQVKLIETHKRIGSCYMEINIRKNSLVVYRKRAHEPNATSTNGVRIQVENGHNSFELIDVDDNDDDCRDRDENGDGAVEILNHKLSNVFKLTSLTNDPLCFGYFYKKNATSFNFYTLHAFRSSKTNLANVVYEFQMQALKLHENLQFEKIYEFRLVKKFELTQEELNIPNFIELCLEKTESTNSSQNQNGMPRKMSTFSTKSDASTTTVTKLKKNKSDLYLNLLSDKRVLLRFGSNRLYLQESGEKPIEQEYKNVLYLNNSITNENFFCLAYSSSSSGSKSRLVDALILYSNNVELIDDVIREYAINVSSELNVLESTGGSTAPYLTADAPKSPKIEQHTCMLCPMQQFVELCECLREYDTQPLIVYDILIDKLNYNLDANDQTYLFECVNKNRKSLDLVDDPTDEDYYVNINQLIMGLVHKLCQKKQNQHLIEYFNSRQCTNQPPADHPANNIFKFIFVNDRKLSLGSNKLHSHSVYYNLSNLSRSKKPTNRLKRSNTFDWSDKVAHGFDSHKENLTHNKLASFLFNSKANVGGVSKSRVRKGSNLLHFIINDLNANDSIRKYIFNRVVGAPANTDQQPVVQQPVFRFKRFKTSFDIRQFWKKVISEQIILSKMEREHRKMNLKAQYLKEKELERREHANSNSRLADKYNLNYVEITPCLKEVDKIWSTWLSEQNCHSQQLIDLDEIRATVHRGVPQAKREKIWFWLKNQYNLRNVNGNVNSSNDSLKLDVSYRDLLRQTTIHQHAVLLDLGRTFPNHPNFAKKFGSGQLALFNVLKAYSIVDNEVGYCQGLSFIVGILLIHVNNDEEKAFELLKFLLVDLNFREQYKPDMMQLQKHMYQLTRLINKNLPDIYSHFDENEISPSLYAAPWFLTLFSSQFQIGFVARVFDFLFAEGSIILFKLSLSILSIHKPLLLSCDSFETIVNHIKTTIPEMSLIESELIINKAYAYEIKSDLDTYEIEFNILHDEYLIAQSYLSKSSSSNFSLNNNKLNCNKYNNNNNNSNSSDDDGADSSNRASRLEFENSKLKREIKDLNEKMQLLKLQIHNQDDYFYKLNHENKQLKCKVDALEIERTGLLKKIKDQEKQLNAL